MYPDNDLLQQKKHRLRWSIAIFVTAFVFRTGLGLATDVFDRRPAGEVARVAQALAAGQGFANPTGETSGPTVHVAPLYPLLLSQAIARVPPQVLPEFVAIFNITVASVVWALLPYAARALELPVATGVLAGLIGALTPTNHWTELNGYWESTFAGLAVLTAAITSSRFRRHAGSTRLGAALGLMWGLLLLLQPAALPVLIVIAAVIMVPASLSARQITPLATMAVVLVLTLTPWTVRNYRTLGGLVFIRGNLGVELSVSNNDGALPDQRNVLENPNARHPHVNRAEFDRRISLGELEYDRQRRSQALLWIQQNPHPFLSLTFQRAWLFWVPSRSNVLLTLAQWGLAVFSATGLILMWLRHRRTFLIIAGIWMTYPLLYYTVQADLRYRYPIEWSIVLAAGLTMSTLLQPIGSRFRFPGWRYFASRASTSARIIPSLLLRM